MSAVFVIRPHRGGLGGHCIYRGMRLGLHIKRFYILPTALAVCESNVVSVAWILGIFLRGRTRFGVAKSVGILRWRAVHLGLMFPLNNTDFSYHI